MLKRNERTMEKYLLAGARMRLYKTLGTKLVNNISGVLSKEDQGKLIVAMKRIDEVCSKAEDNMFRDYPDLSNEYVDVFYGSTDLSLRNDVDRQVMAIARKVADELFPGRTK